METRALLVVALLAGAWALWAVATRALARFRSPARDVAVAGLPLGKHATLLQFSSPTCGVCPAVARLLTQIAADHPGLSHVEVDVSEHPGLVRAHAVRRTPTVLQLDPAGAVLARSSGPVTRGEVLAALDHHLALETR